MYLREVPYIKLNADINASMKVTENELKNYLRLFKSPDETLSHDYIYSPFFDAEKVYCLEEDYAVRMDFYGVLRECLPQKVISVYISYDFSKTPVLLEYSTEGEYSYMGGILQDSIFQTNLSLLLFVSHLNQFADKMGTKLKAEHYHILLKADPATAKEDLDRFVCSLKARPVFNKITVKGTEEL